MKRRNGEKAAIYYSGKHKTTKLKFYSGRGVPCFLITRKISVFAYVKMQQKREINNYKIWHASDGDAGNDFFLRKGGRTLSNSSGVCVCVSWIKYKMHQHGILHPRRNFLVIFILIFMTETWITIWHNEASLVNREMRQRTKRLKNTRLAFRKLDL